MRRQRHDHRAFVDGADDQGIAAQQQGRGQHAFGQRAARTAVFKFGHAQRRAHVGACAVHRQAEHLRIGQALRLRKAFHRAAAPVHRSPIQRTHPQVAFIAGQRGHVDPTQRGMKRAQGLPVVYQHAVFFRSHQQAAGFQRQQRGQLALGRRARSDLPERLAVEDQQPGAFRGYEQLACPGSHGDQFGGRQLESRAIARLFRALKVIGVEAGGCTQIQAALKDHGVAEARRRSQQLVAGSGAAVQAYFVEGGCGVRGLLPRSAQGAGGIVKDHRHSDASGGSEHARQDQPDLEPAFHKFRPESQSVHLSSARPPAAAIRYTKCR